ncbi:winged helix-turn-helix domain-containing protein [Serratia fonticola]|uniref:winged helix-turn-helix domain-containing protein n=1 Tax=Serratia fonticola TaxID=47917 RepID=UPI00217BC6C4|nr:winged helix family transcriptional regulator [Serratia fonticola]CAI0972515.1 Transcriptional activator CadC [Serratia fonticola]
MVFTISNMIAFRSEDGAMWSIAQPESRLSLTTIPSRLFTYLLENADRMVSREELLNNIWDKYGLDPSNNSVNQYISLIRKSLSELGCDEDVIKTVPRVGFYIPGEVVSCSQEPPQSIENASGTAQPVIQQPGLNRRYQYALLAFSLMIAIVLVLQPFHTAFGYLDYRFPKSTLYKIGTIATCPVYSLNDSSPNTAARKEQLAQELAAVNAPCLNNEVFIFHSGQHYAYQQSGRAFITRCNNRDNSLLHFSECKAVYAFAK